MGDEKTITVGESGALVGVAGLWLLLASIGFPPVIAAGGLALSVPLSKAISTLGSAAIRRIKRLAEEVETEGATPDTESEPNIRVVMDAAEAARRAVSDAAMPALGRLVAPYIKNKQPPDPFSRSAMGLLVDCDEDDLSDLVTLLTVTVERSPFTVDPLLGEIDPGEKMHTDRGATPTDNAAVYFRGDETARAYCTLNDPRRVVALLLSHRLASGTDISAIGPTNAVLMRPAVAKRLLGVLRPRQ